MGRKEKIKSYIALGIFTVLGILGFSKLDWFGKTDSLGQLQKLDPEKQADNRLVKLLSLFELYRLDPDDPATMADISSLLESFGNFPEAFEFAKRSLIAAQKNGAPNSVLAQKYQTMAALQEKMGNPDKAMEYLEKAKALMPKSPQLDSDTARVLLTAKKPKRARDYIKKAIRHTPNFPEHYRQLSKAERNLAKPKEKNKKTLEPLKEGIRKNPTSASSFLNLAEGYRAAKNFDKEEAALRRALELDPDNKEAKKLLAANLLKRGKYDEAGFYYKQLDLQQESDAQVKEALGDIALQKGRSREALGYYRDAYRENSTDVALRKKYDTLYNDEEQKVIAKMAQRSNDQSGENAENKGSALMADSVDSKKVSDEISGIDLLSNVAKTNTQKNAKDVNDANHTNASKGTTTGKSMSASDLTKQGKGFSENTRTSLDGSHNFKDSNRLGENKASKKGPDYFDKDAEKKRELESLLRKAENARKRGDANEAIRLYQKAGKIAPNSAEIFYKAGVLQYKQNDFSNARISFERSLKANSEFWKARYSLALANEKAGDNTTAAREYKRVLQEKPNLYPAALNLGLVYKRGKDYNSAIEAFKKALKIKPENAEVYAQLGEVRMLQKKYSASEKYFRQALQKNKSHQRALVNLGLVLYKRGKINESISVLEKYVGRFGNDSSARFSLGQSYQRAKKYSQAEKQYREVARRDPKNAKNWLALAIVLNEKSSGSPEAGKCFRASQKNGGNRFENYWNYGNYLYQKKDYKSAIVQYKAAQKKQPRNSQTALLLAQSYENIGDQEKAAIELSRYLKKNKNNAQVLEKLGFLYAKMPQKKSNAVAVLEKLLQVSPSHPEAGKIKKIIRSLKQ